MSLKGYEKVTIAVSRYRKYEIDFHEFRGWVIPYACSLQDDLGYERKDFYNNLDNWFEYIEFCYLEVDRRNLTLSIANFLELLIEQEPRPIVLPKGDRVVKEQML